jgi:hypothetical protein
MGEWDLFIAGGVVIGALVGIERARGAADRDPVGRQWAALALVACIAAAGADSARGFLYLLLMPIGGYTAARIVTAPIAARWVRRRPSVG